LGKSNRSSGLGSILMPLQTEIIDTIDLGSLACAVLVLEQGSFRKAAEALQVRPSVVSRRVRGLEDHIGVSIFNRTARGIQATIAGGRILKQARGILSDVAALRGVAAKNGTGTEGQLRFGVVASIASSFARHLLASFIRDHPGLELDVFEGSAKESIAAVRALTLDFAFVTGMPLSPGCELEEMWREGVIVAMPQDHSLSSSPNVLWHQLEGERFIVSRMDPGPEIQDYIIRGLAELGRHPQVEQLAVQRETLLGLVGLGQGLSLVGEAEAGVSYPGVVFRPLDHEEIPFSLVWSVTNDNPAFRRFLAASRLRARERRRDREVA